MGQEDEQQVRTKAFAAWQVNAQLMSAAASNAVFLHCLPAHRNDEVTDEVLDGKQSRVWPQAWNRMHTARGLMHWLLTDGAA
jgi:ornithine carbamoyltransferase